MLSVGSWEENVWFNFLSGEKENLDLKAERVKTAPYWKKSSNSTQGRQKLWLNKRVWVSLGGGGSWSPKEGECVLAGQRDEMAAGEGRRWVTGWGSPVWLERKELGQEMRYWRWEIFNWHYMCLVEQRNGTGMFLWDSTKSLHGCWKLSLKCPLSFILNTESFYTSLLPCREIKSDNNFLSFSLQG